MLSCKEASRLISESLDRPLSLRQRMSVAMHVLLCRFCSRFQAQMKLVRVAMQRLAEEQKDELEKATDASLSPEARERIKEALGSQ